MAGAWLFIEARPLRSGLQLSIFMPSVSGTWYFIDSFSSILVEVEVGEVGPGSGDTSLGGVGGKLYRCGLECDAGVSEDTGAVPVLLLQG